MHVRICAGIGTAYRSRMEKSASKQLFTLSMINFAHLKKRTMTRMTEPYTHGFPHAVSVIYQP